MFFFFFVRVKMVYFCLYIAMNKNEIASCVCVCDIASNDVSPFLNRSNCKTTNKQITFSVNRWKGIPITIGIIIKTHTNFALTVFLECFRNCHDPHRKRPAACFHINQLPFNFVNFELNFNEWKNTQPKVKEKNMKFHEKTNRKLKLN